MPEDTHLVERGDWRWLYTYTWRDKISLGRRLLDDGSTGPGCDVPLLSLFGRCEHQNWVLLRGDLCEGGQNKSKFGSFPIAKDTPSDCQFSLFAIIFITRLPLIGKWGYVVPTIPRQFGTRNLWWTVPQGSPLLLSSLVHVFILCF